MANGWNSAPTSEPPPPPPPPPPVTKVDVTYSPQITFPSGAVRGSDVSDFTADIPPEVLTTFATALEDGKAKGYPRDNWKKGFPVRSVIAHLLIHILKYREGDTSEDHLAHALFNLAVLIRQRAHPKYAALDDRVMDDIPTQHAEERIKEIVEELTRPVVLAKHKDRPPVFDPHKDTY